MRSISTDALQQNCWAQQMLLSALFQQQHVMMLDTAPIGLDTTVSAPPNVVPATEEEEPEPPYCSYNPEVKPKRPLSAYNFFL